MTHIATLLALLPLLGGCAATVPDSARFMGGGSAVGDFDLNLVSLDRTRFEGVVRQKYDFSCGSAALATLLRYHYGYKVAEESAFRGMWANGDRDQIRRVGFSLLDMKRWLSSHALTADGYEVSLQKIADTGIPGIALISVKNYRHFVVIKGVRNGEVLLGDPSIGLTVMSVEDFTKAWNGIYFVLSDSRDLARQSFDRDIQWAGYARAPVGNGFPDPVSLQTLMLTAPFYGDIS